ncbi:MAG: potassium transporter TrkG [Oligosphaeraceae bacterium]
MSIHFRQGLLWGLSPLALLWCDLTPATTPAGPLRLSLALLFGLLLSGGAALLPRHPRLGRWLGGAALPVALATLGRGLAENPLLALLFGLLAIGGVFLLLEDLDDASAGDIRRRRLAGAASVPLTLAILSPLLPSPGAPGTLGLLLTGAIVLTLWPPRCARRRGLAWLLAAAALAPLALSAFHGALPAALLPLSALALAHALSGQGHLSAALPLRHPARCLALTFILLPAVGTLLLRLDLSLKRDISVLDAAFTAVSASCVTGLSTLDVGATFTRTGQTLLLLLIQLGGLGIISLAALILHALGRLSISHERLARQLSPDDRQDLLQSLRGTLLVCLVSEAVGALWLAGAFALAGKPLGESLWLGLFTAISAFCNAGFFPEATSLEAYADQPLLLHGVAALIIAGGLAPTIALWATHRRRHTPERAASAVMAVTSLLLLIGGALLLAALESDGIFGGLTATGCLNNAWFLSASARTAGFSSVPIAGLGGLSQTIMLLLMSVGGSPGGTAGGIKTTTLAVLALAFRSAVAGQEAITVRGRRLSPSHLMQAIAITFAAALSLALVTLALAVTQDAPFHELVFEATSALATVGLTLGATPRLDEVGKAIVMFAMYLGRIGPLTFFLMLGEHRAIGEPRLPQTHIPLG